LRDIGEARILLSDPARLADTVSSIALPSIGWKRRIALWLLAAAAVSGIAGAGILYLGQSKLQSKEVVRLALVLPEGKTLFINRSMTAISPDGRQIAFARPSGLHLRRISESETRIIPGTEGFFNLTEPAFSPDGH
jgi:hypothetical protein